MLSVCAIALNEEQLLGDMLASVRHVADELVLGIDSRTTDRTREIAEAFGTRVIPIEWHDDFSYARNLTLEAATGDWALVLDADERLTPLGVAAVRAILDYPGDPCTELGGACSGFALEIEQQDLVGVVHGVHPTSARLFLRSACRYMRRIHEEPIGIADLSVTRWGLLTGGPHIIHVGYDASLWLARGKEQRNRRLLGLQLADHPDDLYARERLARMDDLIARGGMPRMIIEPESAA